MDHTRVRTPVKFGGRTRVQELLRAMRIPRRSGGCASTRIKYPHQVPASDERRHGSPAENTTWIRLTYRVRPAMVHYDPKLKDKRTERLAAGDRVPQFESFRRQAEKRLRLLEAATSLRDLAQIPGNRLEALSGDRKGQYSVRINQQWRICFEWPENSDAAENVEIVDYH